MKYLIELDDRSIELDITEGEGGPIVRLEDRELAVHLASVGPTGPYSLLLDDASYEGYVESTEGGYRVILGGQVFQMTVEEAARARLHGLAGAGAKHEGVTIVAAPMPGLVIGVPVEVGQTVKRGETVVILQAMKMENELRTPRDGTIKEILAQPGDTVAQGQPLVTLE
ncbi:MAG TPA: biotin/lipoyl-containing protein [Dehalococcoidia bacterium]|nr:biotin/lipoyl-containing protein [Dehalococcoidia bacterium]